MEDYGVAILTMWCAVACVTAVILFIALTIMSLFVPIALWFAAVSSVLGGAAYATARFIIR